MIARTPPTCPDCGQPYKGIYAQHSRTFVGDSFIRWNVEGHKCPTPTTEVMKAPGSKYLTIRYLRNNQSLERGLNRTNNDMKVTQVTMKLTCGPVTSHTDGVLKDGNGKDYINKNITMNAQYSNNPDDNNFASATPWAKLEFALGNPAADIFAPGRKYKVYIEEYTE